MTGLHQSFPFAHLRARTPGRRSRQVPARAPHAPATATASQLDTPAAAAVVAGQLSSACCVLQPSCSYSSGVAAMCASEPFMRVLRVCTNANAYMCAACCVWCLPLGKRDDYKQCMSPPQTVLTLVMLSALSHRVLTGLGMNVSTSRLACVCRACAVCCTCTCACLYACDDDILHPARFELLDEENCSEGSLPLV